MELSFVDLKIALQNMSNSKEKKPKLIILAEIWILKTG